MIKYLVRRLIEVPLVLFFISLIVFSLVHITPGDPVHLMLGDFYNEADAARIRRNLGLDQPLPVQYLSWVGGALRLDFGASVYTGRPITQMILDRVPYTFSLAFVSITLALLIAIPTGVLAAHRHNTLVDYFSMLVAMLGISIPHFALALLMILTLAVHLDLLPISGPGDPLTDPIGSIRFYVMPVAALATGRLALMSRMLRASMLEVLNQDYVRTARAKGLSDQVVLYRHALRNALIPLITTVAIGFAYTLGGAVVVETIFSLPGLGSLMLDALLRKDFPLIQGIAFVSAAVFVVGNIIADMMYALVDPRIRYG